MKGVLTATAATLLAGLLISPALAQVGGSTNSQPPAVTQGNPSDVGQGELSKYDRFADSHPRLARELDRHPGLADNPQFLSKHPEFAEFLKKHPQVRAHLREHGQRVVRRERHFDQRRDRRRDYRLWRAHRLQPNQRH